MYISVSPHTVQLHIYEEHVGRFPLQIPPQTFPHPWDSIEHFSPGYFPLG